MNTEQGSAKEITSEKLNNLNIYFSENLHLMLSLIQEAPSTTDLCPTCHQEAEFQQLVDYNEDESKT